MKEHEKQVSFLRAFVKHYTFVTGLVGRVAGKEGSPEDSSVGVNVILNADVEEGYKVKDPLGAECPGRGESGAFPLLEQTPYHNVLRGAVFQCCDLLSFIAGTFDSQDLRQLAENKRESPTEFVIETWKVVGPYKWALTKRTHWEGVKWLDAAHTTTGGDRCCAGVATFVCDKKWEEDIENSEVVTVPAEKRHPRIELRRILQQGLPGPKHPASYLG